MVYKFKLLLLVVIYRHCNIGLSNSDFNNTNSSLHKK